MKKYTPLDGLRWSRNSDSALNNMPQTDVLGRAGGGEFCSIFGAERNNNRLLRSLLAIIMPLNERGKRTDYTKLIQ